MIPEQTGDSFVPGRDLNSTCLSNPDGRINSTQIRPMNCIVWPGDAVNTPVLANDIEFFKTSGNQSENNKVYLSDGYAVLGPAKRPPDVDFTANSFGSKTSCRVVTSLCGARSTIGSRNLPPSYSNFICNSTAGLNMTGNFLSLSGDTSLGRIDSVEIRAHLPQGAFNTLTMP